MPLLPLGYRSKAARDAATVQHLAASMQQRARSGVAVLALLAVVLPACILDWESQEDDGAGGSPSGPGATTTATSTASTGASTTTGGGQSCSQTTCDLDPCGAGQTCQYTCSQSNCTISCADAASCVVDCQASSCAVDCGTADECVVHVNAGSVEVQCSGATTCTVDGLGDGKVDCGTAETCNVACTLTFDACVDCAMAGTCPSCTHPPACDGI